MAADVTELHKVRRIEQNQQFMDFWLNGGKMARRSKKSKKRRSASAGKKDTTRATESVAYYFLAAIGLFLVVLLAIAILNYFNIL
jgi:hypothetical protein